MFKELITKCHDFSSCLCSYKFPFLLPLPSDKASKYQVESIQKPAARIQLYKKGVYIGPDDIALVRTKSKVVFVPGRIMPVRISYKFTREKLN